MRLTMTRKNARVLALFALSSRLFLGLAIDMPELQNAAWASALIGGVICFPVLLAIDRLVLRNRDAPSEPTASDSFLSLSALFLELILGLWLVWDAAGIASLLSLSVDYATMTSLRATPLLISLYAALFMALCAGGDGVAGAARLWSRLFPAFFLIVLCQHAHSYNLRWLTPIFGPGVGTITRGGLYAGGFLMPAAVFGMIAEPEESRRHVEFPALGLVAAVVAGALLALHAAMLPAQTPAAATRIFQLDSLASNGRASIASQLPMTIILFSGMLSALMFQLLMASSLLQRCLPAWKNHTCVFVVCGISLGIALLHGAEQCQLLALGHIAYPAVSIISLLAASGARNHVRKEKKT